MEDWDKAVNTAIIISMLYMLSNYICIIEYFQPITQPGRRCHLDKTKIGVKQKRVVRSWDRGCHFKQGFSEHQK